MYNSKNLLFIALFLQTTLPTHNLYGMSATQALPTSRETKADYESDLTMHEAGARFIDTSASSKRGADHIVILAAAASSIETAPEPEVGSDAYHSIIGDQKKLTEDKKASETRSIIEHQFPKTHGDRRQTKAEWAAEQELLHTQGELNQKKLDADIKRIRQERSLEQTAPPAPLEARIAEQQSAGLGLGGQASDLKRNTNADNDIKASAEQLVNAKIEEAEHRNTILRAANKVMNDHFPPPILNIIGDYLSLRRFKPSDKILKNTDGLFNRMFSKIFSIIELANGHIASSSNDDTIQIWDLDTGFCVQTLRGHTDNVLCIIELNSNNIASCSEDNTIKIWDPITGACLQTLIGHDGIMVYTGGDYDQGTLIERISSVIELANGYLASCAIDSTIKIWNPVTGICLQTLRGHGGFFTDGEVRSIIELVNGTLASCSVDSTIKLWNPVTGICLQTLRGHGSLFTKGHVFSIIELMSGNLASCSMDGTIKTWNPLTGACLQTLKGHGDFVSYNAVLSILELSDGRIASCGADSTIKIWDLSTGTLLQTLEGHTQYVFKVIELADGRLASCSRDGTIRIWDIIPSLATVGSNKDLNGSPFYKRHPKKTITLGAAAAAVSYYYAPAGAAKNSAGMLATGATKAKTAFLSVLTRVGLRRAL